MKTDMSAREPGMLNRPTYLLHTLQHRPSGLTCNVRQYPDGTLRPEGDFTRIGFWSHQAEKRVQAAIDDENSEFVLIDTALVTPGHHC